MMRIAVRAAHRCNGSMGRPSDDYALLIEAVEPIELDLALGLLEQAGIPTLVHGGDFDLAELGLAAHNATRRPNLYVPHLLRGRARAVLDEAWGAEGRPALAPGELEEQARLSESEEEQG
jgi:hypothetical protein